MKELDLLKKDWNKTKNQFTTISASEIGNMLLQKSSSIVKKLFYISIAELIFWVAFSILPPIFSTTVKDKMNTIEGGNVIFFKCLTVFSFAIILVFVYLLFKSYRTISNTDSIKVLMKNIIKTRKVIKYYVIYNLVGLFIAIVLGMYFSFQESPEVLEKITSLTTAQVVILFGIVGAIVIGFLLLIWFFYKILYGFLIHKLNLNYQELKKLEV